MNLGGKPRASHMESKSTVSYSLPLVQTKHIQSSEFSDTFLIDQFKQSRSRDWNSDKLNSKFLKLQ